MKLPKDLPLRITFYKIICALVMISLINCQPPEKKIDFPVLNKSDNLDTLVDNTYLKEFPEMKVPINFSWPSDWYYFGRGDDNNLVNVLGGVSYFDTSYDSLLEMTTLLLKSDSIDRNFYVDEIKWIMENYHTPLKKIKGVYIVNPINGDNQAFRSISVIRKKLTKPFVKAKIKNLTKFHYKNHKEWDNTTCRHYSINDQFDWTEKEDLPQHVIDYLRKFHAIIN
ncbi:MAG: hypothetical protein WAT92_17750 [Saprospiraceae bacterium]|nr:hypothetical protein [Saprospiraceae bacterium]